jgi:hypothetical protein
MKRKEGKMKKRLVVCLSLIVFCHAGRAQNSTNGLSEGYLALARSDVQAKKVDIIRQNITLTDDQAKTFWPLQRSYESDLNKLGDQRVSVIKEYAQNWDNLSDSNAKDLGTRLLDYQKKRVDLRKKYFDRMSKEISPTIAAKFFQVEIQMEDLIDLVIASAVPLVK